jgi:hypothetical protein
MKRLLIVAGITTTLALPSSAAAAQKHYLGTVHQGGTVSFTVRSHNGHKRVVDFHWNDVPVSCQSGDRQSTYTFSHPMRVRRDHFHGLDVSPQGGALHVTGDLTHREHRANGTLRISGDISEGNACESGQDNWRAHKIL